jgi:hypothetical protein
MSKILLKYILLLPILGGSHKKKEKIRKTKEKLLEENHKNIPVKRIYQNVQKLSKIGWGRLKYTRLKNLIVYFHLMKAS